MIVQNNQGLILMRSTQLGERSWRNDNCYKMVFSPLGKSQYQTKFGDIKIGEQAFLVFNPNEEHRQLSVSKEKFIVELSPDLILETLYALGHPSKNDLDFAMLSSYNQHVQKWAVFLREFLKEEDSALEKELFLEHSMVQLVILLLKYGIGSHQTTLPALSGTKENIHSVISSLKEGYQETWSLEDMAAISGMNKYQFSHEFKSATGLAPYSWLQVYRIIKSQHDLIHTEDTILQVALQHGFSTVSAYNVLFKKLYGRTPVEYRHKFR
ncbi:helix-turn-helix transcriptional regulator [Lysinibacillus sphaericus]